MSRSETHCPFPESIGREGTRKAERTWLGLIVGSLCASKKRRGEDLVIPSRRKLACSLLCEEACSVFGASGKMTRSQG